MRIAGTEITFTFHYVSINTVGGTGGEGGADIFTFHYVSINTASMWRPGSMGILYIPLCFY